MKLVTPIYLGVMGLLVAGVIPLLISLGEGSEFVQVRSGRYFLFDYSIYTLLRFLVIISGIGLLYMISLRPHHAVRLMGALFMVCVVMGVLMIV